jgi:inhibitor of cysteine peptidase
MRMTDWRGRGRYLVLTVLVAALTSIPLGLSGAIAGAGNTVRVTDADNGRTLTLASGDALVVSLASTLGTGFGWKVGHVDAKVLRQTGPSELVHPPNPMLGAPATQVFRFVATGGGSTRLELDYVRPWERGVPPARTFHLGLTVR